MNKVCYFCEGKKFNTIWSKGVFYKCKKCGLISIDNFSAVENAKEYYSSTYYPEGFSGRSNLKEAFSYRLPIVARFLKRGEEVLEIGSASGDFLNIVKNFGYKVRGVELSNRAVETAKNVYGLDLFCGTLKDAHFLDNSFQSIMSYHVLEHLKDVRGFLEEVYKITKLDGVFLIEVPNPSSIDGYFSKDLLGSILDYPNHNFAFPPKVLKTLLEKTGFEVIYTEKSFSYLISSAIGKIKKHFKKSKNKNDIVDDKTPTKEKWKDISKYKNKGFIYRIMTQIFPGMKFTIVVKKPKVIV